MQDQPKSACRGSALEPAALSIATSPSPLDENYLKKKKKICIDANKL